MSGPIPMNWKLQIKNFDPNNPSKEDIYEFCPMMIEENIWQDWYPFCKNELNIKPLPIAKLPTRETGYNTWIIARTDKNKDFNPKNKIEEARSRGTEFVKDIGEDPYLYDLLSFTVQDETEFTKARINYKEYPKYRDMLWSSKPSDVFAIKGFIKPGFRMIFVNEMLDLKKQKQRIDNTKKRIMV